MDGLKEYVTTLVSMLIIITSIEFIAPDNSMKKYIKFVMGLILIAVMLTPLINIFTKDVSSFSNNLEKYLELESYEDNREVYETKKSEQEIFKKNLEENCKLLLQEQFKNLKFQLDIDCELDSKNVTYSINEIKVIVTEKGTNKIEKVIINKNEEKTYVIEEQDEIISYLSETLKISKDKIKIN